ncbi:MAG TPA: sigma 54-interacting transcriptional regulator [Kiritimatiellia bacterium]|nr:sigma 54-interacting transcriptional regulator [Kiritimatiellia bacterium]
MRDGQKKEDSADALLPLLVESTSGETGLPFFRALVNGLVKALNTHGAWVTEYIEESNRLRAIAFRLGDDWLEDYEYAVEGTPCGTALHKGGVVFLPDRVLDIYPHEKDLRQMAAVSYIGAPLFDESGKRILGHVGVLDTKPMSNADSFIQIFQIFVNRAGAELRRLNLERELRSRTEELDAVVESAMDAILILDEEHEVVRANRAALEMLGASEVTGHMLDRYLTGASAEKIEPLLCSLDDHDPSRRQLWIPGNFVARRQDGQLFTAEGTLSRFDLGGRKYFTVIIRDVEERIASERRFDELREREAYLREEVEHHFGEIVGESPSMRKVIQEIKEVALTDASVLVFGETGTGKELVARAVHRASRRSAGPLIKVNCAAIPANLMESEFFGHEKGAFTGAVNRREGRFALADGGTIFLDEIGELPMELQVKLLRVLQEGEFEPVGSSKTRKVDVRVIAATNRDLRTEIEKGRFREDLYYRISVFPIHVPALRHRGSDVVLLAQAFIARFCERDGCVPPVLSTRDAERLREYAWPGNVRELANVIERAMITGDGKILNLDRALPATLSVSTPPLPSENTQARVLSAREIEQMEIENIRLALKQTGGRVSGPNGAAALLGIKPTTLSSRIKKLGIIAN